MLAKDLEEAKRMDAKKKPDEIYISEMFLNDVKPFYPPEEKGNMQIKQT